MSTIIDFLIVDDEESWQTNLKELVGEKYTSHVVGSLDEALAKIDRQYYYCALVDKSLVPMKGEDVSGGKVLERLKNLGEGTKGLMITNYPDDWRSEKAALRDWSVSDYLAKAEVGSVEGFNKVREQLYKMHADSVKEYGKRYGSGITQLTSAIPGRERAGWESSLITNFSVPGKRVDYKMLAQFLDTLIKYLPPLLSYEPGNSIRFIKENQVVEGKYWSKGLGYSVVVQFGKKENVELQKSLISPQQIVRYVDRFSLAGLIYKAELDFTALPFSR